MLAMLMFGARFTVCDVDAGRSEEVVVGVERVAVTVLDTPGPWAGKEKKCIMLTHSAQQQLTTVNYFGNLCQTRAMLGKYVTKNGDWKFLFFYSIFLSN